MENANIMKTKVLTERQSLRDNGL